MLRRIGRAIKKFAKKVVFKFKKAKKKIVKLIKNKKSKKSKKDRTTTGQPDQAVVEPSVSYAMKFVTVVAVASGVFFVTWPFTGAFAPFAEPVGYALLATAGIELGT
jgi:hypothetical protein